MSRTGTTFAAEHSRIGQSMVDYALRIRDAQAKASAARLIDPILRRPGDVRDAHVAVPAPRPQLTCTPRPGMTACNAFDLATAEVVQVPAGTVVPAWPGPGRGWFAGGTTIQIRLPNGHYAIAYGRDFTRAQTPAVSGDRMGQSLVSAALQLDAARRAQQELAERIQKATGQGAPTKGPPLRLPAETLEDVRRRGGLEVSRVDPNRRRPPTRAELFRRYGVIEGRAIIDRPRGIQIWSHPFNAYRPGTGIHLMERLFVLPQGTRVFLTPDAVLVDAVLNNEGNGAQFGSYHVQWSVAGDAFEGVFRALGIPVAGTGWARPFAPDSGPWFRDLSAPVIT